MSLSTNKTTSFDNKLNLSDWLSEMPSKQRAEFMQLVYQNLAAYRARKYRQQKKQPGTPN